MARPDSARPAQADAEFIAGCQLPDAPFAAALAVEVRREVARRAGMAPEAVRAADRLPEEWGALFHLDAVEFVMELEARFGVSIPDRATAAFGRASVSVADLAAELARGAVAYRRWW